LQYTFGENEYSIVDYTQPGLSKPSDKYNSSWYLSSVYSRRSGKHVNFLYSGPLLQVGDPITSHSFVEFLPQAGVSPIALTSNQQISVPKNQVVHLEKIQWEGGEVRFLRSSGRVDLDGGQKLDAVEIRNNMGELIKSFQFGYSYFDTNKHLKLNSVTEKDALNNPMPPHTFEYLEGTMPASISFAMDHFGFYNGKANPSLVPSFNNAFHNLITQADRSSDSQASMVGVLKKINYPTGGSTAFDYESNDYYSASAPTNIDTRENIVCSATAEKCDINGVLYYQPDGSAVIGLLCQSIVETSFISTQSGFDYQLILKASMNTSSPPVISSGDLVINLYRTDQSLIVPILTRGVTDDLEITENIASVISANVNYLLRVESKVLGVSLRATIVNKIAGLPVPGKSNSYLVSGIRLASMTHNNPSTSIPVRGFTYKYNLESDLGASSGVLMAKQPSYKYVYRQAADVHTSLGTYIVHQGSPKGLLGSLSDSHVVYSQVEEREFGFGSTRYIYSATKDVPLPASIYTPTYYDHTSSSWKNGQLVAVKKFNESGDLLSKQESLYSYPLKAVTKSFIFEADGIVNALPTYNSYRHHLFDQESGWTRLDQTINSSYANGQELKVVQNYNYADPSLVLPTSTESISSTGTILKEETSYLNNRTSYVISLPISKISYDRGSQVGKELFNYFSDFKLQSKEIFDRNNQLTKKTTLSNYNGLKPSFIQESNGSKQLFLWGYGQTLPVAVLTNADFGEAYYQGFEDNGTKGYAKTGESYLNSGSYTILSTDFAPINVSTLKMSYWFWEGGLWKFSGVLDYTPTISSTGSRLDEIRVYPKGSIMTTYTYRLGFGISSLTDANNNSTYYEYDDFARLTVVRDNSRRILKSTVYKYRGQ
jgi:YD repeat-containing protein